MLDAVNLEALGIPTVTFVTEPFVAAARAHMDVLGVDVPIVVVPSDYLPEADDAVAARVAAVFDDVLAGLTAARLAR